MAPKVTIGVCVKNSEKTIRESVSSVINQKYPTEFIQIIIVDGCSKDKTMSIIYNVIEKTSMKVEIYSDKSGGISKARQHVVNKANGKYIIFVDSDVKLFDDFTKKLVGFMDENPKVGVAFGKPMYQEGGALVSAVRDLYWYAIGGFLGNSATIYRPEAIHEVCGFDQNIKGAGEDTDLINRIRAKGWLVSVGEKARFFHKSRENLREFWLEQYWFGYGDHYISHKNKNGNQLWHRLPIGSFRYGLRVAIKAYRLTHIKISFLIPLQSVFGNISWWFGFVKGHIEGYGHVSPENFFSIVNEKFSQHV